MTREEYNTTKRDYRVFGWVLVAQWLFAMVFWAVVIYTSKN